MHSASVAGNLMNCRALLQSAFVTSLTTRLTDDWLTPRVPPTTIWKDPEAKNLRAAKICVTTGRGDDRLVFLFRSKHICQINNCRPREPILSNQHVIREYERIHSVSQWPWWIFLPNCHPKNFHLKKKRVICFQWLGLLKLSNNLNKYNCLLDILKRTFKYNQTSLITITSQHCLVLSIVTDSLGPFLLILSK